MAHGDLGVSMARPVTTNRPPMIARLPSWLETRPSPLKPLNCHNWPVWAFSKRPQKAPRLRHHPWLNSENSSFMCFFSCLCGELPEPELPAWRFVTLFCCVFPVFCRFLTDVFQGCLCHFELPNTEDFWVALGPSSRSLIRERYQIWGVLFFFVKFKALLKESTSGFRGFL